MSGTYYIIKAYWWAFIRIIHAVRFLVFEEFVNLGREVHNTVELLSFG
jgi:hypothetical protein